MSPGTRKGGENGGNGAGNGAGGFDDFFIRDRDDEQTAPTGYEDHPRGGYDPYEDFASGSGAGSTRARQPGFDRGLVDSITRIIEGLASVAGDSLSPETRRQLEKALRDLLMVLRDVIDAMIARIDSRRDDDFEIEEIPID
ncbi:MAG: hypothetical protein JHC98_09540 [Thermoleophilaceae bacterium]|nr:hypothetical protein [Thermoleophilaceae bacterium]